MVLSEVSSDYAELNTALNSQVPPPSKAWWFVNLPNQKGLRWERLSLPAVSGSSLNALRDAVQAQGGGRLVSIAQPFTSDLGPRNGTLDLEWGTGRYSRANAASTSARLDWFHSASGMLPRTMTGGRCDRMRRTSPAS